VARACVDQEREQWSARAQPRTVGDKVKQEMNNLSNIIDGRGQDAFKVRFVGGRLPSLGKHR